MTNVRRRVFITFLWLCGLGLATAQTQLSLPSGTTGVNPTGIGPDGRLWAVAIGGGAKTLMAQQQPGGSLQPIGSLIATHFFGGLDYCTGNTDSATGPLAQAYCATSNFYPTGDTSLFGDLTALMAPPPVVADTVIQAGLSPLGVQYKCNTYQVSSGKVPAAVWGPYPNPSKAGGVMMAGTYYGTNGSPNASTIFSLGNSCSLTPVLALGYEVLGIMPLTNGDFLAKKIASVVGTYNTTYTTTFQIGIVRHQDGSFSNLEEYTTSVVSATYAISAQTGDLTYDFTNQQALVSAQDGAGKSHVRLVSSAGTLKELDLSGVSGFNTGKIRGLGISGQWVALGRNTWPTNYDNIDLISTLNLATGQLGVTVSVPAGISYLPAYTVRVSPDGTLYYGTLAVSGVAMYMYPLPLPPTPTATLAASPVAITTGGSTTLNWNTANAANVSIDNGIGLVDPLGTKTVSPTSTTTYTLTATGPGGLVTASVTVTVTPANLPKITGIANSWSGKTGAQAPGSWLSIYGSNLASGVFYPDGLVTSLGGTQVLVNGKPALMNYASPGQVNLFLPFEVPTGWVTVTMTSPFGSVSVMLAITSASPALLPDPSGHLFAQDPFTGKQVNTTTGGGILTLYALGLGAVSPAVPTGTPASANPLSWVVAQSQVLVGGVAAQVLFCGLAPGFVGLYQVNIQVATGTPTGNQPVVLSVGDTKAPPLNLEVQ